MQSHATASRADQNRALGLSTIAFTACFAVWTIFSIIGVAIKGELGLNDTQFGLLVATPILTGSLTRIFLGVWTERYGGRNAFEWRSRYWTFLLRLDPERPSTTLQAQPGPWVGPFHWENVATSAGVPRARRLRVNEMLRLMSFPDDFRISGSRADVQRQLGNAVPLELGKAVVRALISQLGYLPAQRGRAAVLA